MAKLSIFLIVPLFFAGFLSLPGSASAACPSGQIADEFGGCYTPAGSTGGCPAGQIPNALDGCDPATPSNGNTIPIPVPKPAIPSGGSAIPVGAAQPGSGVAQPNAGVAQPNGGAAVPTQTFTVRFVNPLNKDKISDLIKAAIDIVLQLAVPVVVIFFMWAGFQYIAAQGNSTKLAKAHSTFFYTVIGTAILFGAWALAQIVAETIKSIRNF